MRGSLAGALLLFVSLAQAAAIETPKGESPKSTGKRVDASVNEKRTARKSAAPSKPRTRHSKMRQYKDKEGNLTITNIPEKYERRKEFVEVSLKYQSIVVAPRYKSMKSASQYTSSNIAELVRENAKRYLVDENLVHAVIGAESGGDPYAVSPAGARGLMQLMPETAAEMGVTDIFDPAQNIAGGTQYLAKMLNLFNNDLSLALAAYNAGPNAVKEYGGIPPYPETQQYVRIVSDRVGKPSKYTKSSTFVVKSSKPRADALPVNKKCYILHLRSGYTQAAEKIIDEDPYYYVQFGNRTALVPKHHVVKIDEPA